MIHGDPGDHNAMRAAREAADTMTVTDLGTFVERCTAESEPLWSAYVRHPWIEGLATGATTRERFVFFHAYDVVFSADMHRSLALGIAKAPVGAEWARAAVRVLHETFIADKLEGKRQLLRSLHVREQAFAERSESIPTRDAYSAHLLRTAWEGTLGEIAAALLPCAMFTELIGARFAAEKLVNRTYHDWAAHYRNECDQEMTRQHAMVMQAASGVSEAMDERMALSFTRSVYYQVRVLDGAWACHDPWAADSAR
jgi:thiaminase (transcriptional activator TenA)